MARNSDITLTPEQASKVLALTILFGHNIGNTAEIAYTKRDGTQAVLIGTVTEVRGGTPDHKVVCVETDKGPRSANLFLVSEALFS